MFFSLNKNIWKVEAEEEVSCSCKRLLYEIEHVILSNKCYQFSFNPTNCEVCLDPYFLHWEVKRGECPMLQNMIITSQTTTIVNNLGTNWFGKALLKESFDDCMFSPPLLCKEETTLLVEDMSTVCAWFCPLYPEEFSVIFLVAAMLSDTLTYPHIITAYHKNKSQEENQLSQNLAIWLHLL